MKSRILFLLTILVGSASVSAQNLVPNGSFEEGVNCPSFIGNLDEECLHWFSSIQYANPTNNPTPEWYHTCGELDFLTPPNVAFGYQEPFDGEGYAGIVVYNNQLGISESYREPIGVELIEPLVEGSTYLVEFSIVRLFVDPNAVASNNFGFKFTTQASFGSSSLIIDNTATFKIDTIVSDTTNWLTVTAEVLADGNYSYIHFGNFFDNQNTDFNVDGELGIYTNIALDAISVTEVLPNNTNTGINISYPSIFPNPTNEKVTIKSTESLVKCELYTLNGSLIESIKVNYNSSMILDMDLFPSGTYILHILTRNSTYHEKIIKN